MWPETESRTRAKSRGEGWDARTDWAIGAETCELNSICAATPSDRVDRAATPALAVVWLPWLVVEEVFFLGTFFFRESDCLEPWLPWEEALRWDRREPPDDC